MNVLRRFPAVIASSLLLLACDAQVDPRYDGEPLATIKGSIVSSTGGTASHLHTAVVNFRFTVDDTYHADYAPVVGSFPAQFSIDLDVPPPSDTLNDFTQGGTQPSESRFSTGYIFVVRDGVDLNTNPADAIVGIAEEYVLVYVESDVQPGSRSAQFLGGALTAGYHLMKYVPMDAAELQAVEDCKATSSDPAKCGDATDRLVPNPEEFASEVTITTGPSSELHEVNIF